MTVFFECFQVAKTAVLINCSILIEFLARSIANKAGRGDEFNVDLDALARILHLLVRLGNILGIWQFDRHLAASVSTRYRPEMERHSRAGAA